MLTKNSYFDLGDDVGFAVGCLLLDAVFLVDLEPDLLLFLAGRF